MAIKRRKFLKSTALFGLASALPLKAFAPKDTPLAESAETEDNTDIDTYDGDSWQEENKVSSRRKKTKTCYVLPPSLDEYSTVGIMCPASPTNMTETRYGRRLMKEEGCTVVNADSVRWQKNEHRYLANTDEYRAEEFMAYIKDPNINAIFTARGGFGCIRMLNLLDYNAIAQNPKMIIGFSDISALLLAIHAKTKIVTYHGPVASSVKNDFSKKHLREICFYNKYKLPHIVPMGSSQTINSGYAMGRLIGGNLTVLISLMGTPFEVDTRGKILFLEEVSEDGYQVDRMLKQLELAGKFDHVAGVMIGTIKNLNSRRPFYPNKGYTIKELLIQYFKKYDFPVLYNAPFGHVDNNMTLPIGTYAEFHTDRKRLILHNAI